jgi:hypothetical protein
MSLELVIEKNTEAIRELIAVIKAGSGVAVTNISATEVVERPGKVADAVAPVVKPEPEPLKQAESTPEQPADKSPVTYQEAASAITKLSREKGRDVAIEVLAKFGATKLPEVKPEKFADLVAAVKKAIGA